MSNVDDIEPPEALDGGNYLVHRNAPIVVFFTDHQINLNILVAYDARNGWARVMRTHPDGRLVLAKGQYIVDEFPVKRITVLWDRMNYSDEYISSWHRRLKGATQQ